MRTSILSRTILAISLISGVAIVSGCGKSSGPNNNPVTTTSSTQIYYRRSVTGPFVDELWNVSDDGSNDSKVNLSLPANLLVNYEDMAEVSKDGKTIVFLAYVDNPRQYGIYKCNIDGSNVKPVMTDGGEYLALQSFIDPSSILFWQAKLNADIEVYRVNLDGSNKQKISITLPYGITLSNEELMKVTADGKSIIFITQTTATGAYSIYKCNLDGSGASPVLHESGDANITLQDVTSGNVAFYRKQINSVNELWSVNLDGTDQHKINISLPPGLYLQNKEMAKVTGDGNLVFSTANADGSSQAIYKSKLDGSGVTLVKQLPVRTDIAIQAVQTITAK